MCLFKQFTLKATINHSGTLQAGHYWAHIKDEDNSGWLKCNDTSVIAKPFSGLSNTSSFVFFLGVWLCVLSLCVTSPHATTVQLENQLFQLRFLAWTYPQQGSFYEEHCNGNWLASHVFVVLMPKNMLFCPCYNSVFL